MKEIKFLVRENFLEQQVEQNRVKLDLMLAKWEEELQAD